MADPTLVLVVPVAGAVALVFAWLLTRSIFRKDTGSPEMAAIGEAIREGAMAYLKRQYKTIAVVSVILGAIIMALIEPRPWVGVAFLLGAFCSSLSGYIGMFVSVKSNIRTASAARRSLNEALTTSFRGGAVSGFSVVALSLLGVAGIFYAYKSLLNFEIDGALNGAVGYAFGASFAALFAQLGGGIYTKAADVGADLVGKVEAGIPEDDPRNPAVIADLVGDNVGDCAGRGADLFESTAAENIGAMLLGFSIWIGLGGNDDWTLGFIFFPLIVRGFGIFASIVGVLIVKLRDENEEPVKALNRGYYVACILAAVVFFICAQQLLGETYAYFFGCGLIGIILSIVIVYITQYYTAGEWRPVREIAQASKTGPATTIITGFSVALETTLMPIIAIAIALLSSFYLGTLATPPGPMTLLYGFYGTAVATMGMLATAAFILAEDTFGPITDNAGGIIEMSKQPEEIRRRTDRLDALGNTTKALTKGYAMASAGLAAFLLFGAYFERVAMIKENVLPGNPISAAQLGSWFHVDIAYPEVFVGAMVGGVLVFIFSSLAIRAVGKAASKMIDEVRRQFKEIPGIMEGTAKPDYAKCVDIATAGALRAMVLPGILPVIVPLILGLTGAYVIGDSFGHDINGDGIADDVTFMTIGAMLMVGTIVGILMATMFNNGGGAWDNAKKYIEAGNYGGKKSPAHAAAVVGDTVGDPFKDTAGPSLHVLVKLLSTITLVFVSLFVLSGT